MNSSAAPPANGPLERTGLRDADAALASLRASGAARVNPVRFQFMEALARRSSAQTGRTQQVLIATLREALRAYDVEVHAVEAKAVEAQSIEATGATGAKHESVNAVKHGGATDHTFAALFAHIAAQTPADAAGPVALEAARQRAAYPELPAIDYFRETWAKVSTNQQVRKSQEQVHENAGPLNSSSLVHRSLSLMRERSPGYLRQFLSYVDALSWLEQMHAGSAANKDGPRSTVAKKTGRSKKR